MASDYYNGYGGGPSGKRRRSLVMRLVDLALTLVTLAVGATMIFAFIMFGAFLMVLASLKQGKA